MPNNDRVNRSLRRLGLGDMVTGRVERFLSADAEDAAELVRKALERFVDQINDDSKSDVLKGYHAVKKKVDSNENKRRLQRSGVQLITDLDWFVFVEASAAHQGTASGSPDGLNIFNILDSGRKALPMKPKGQAYPLFNLGNNRLQGRRSGAGGASIANQARAKRVNRKTIAQRQSHIRTSKGQPGSGYFHTYNPDEEVIIFSRGPLKAVAAKNLYERALKQAKDDLSGSGFKDWDVIYVGKVGK